MTWALALMASALFAVPQPDRLPPAKIAQIQRLISAEMARQHIPGLSVAIATDHALRWAEGFGMADLENSVPAKPYTVYRLGSISKPITAVAVMQLAERKKLDLDASIRTYVPAFPPKPWRVTVRQLLGHLGGVRHYRTLAEVDSTKHYSNLLDPLDAFKNDPLLFEPGTHFHYSSYGYTLLGAALENVAGTKFADYVRRNIAEPAGMDGTQPDDVYKIIRNRAHGYRLRRDGQVENCALADTSNKIPAGGFVASADDLVRFAIAVEQDVLLGRESVRQMFTSQRTRDGPLTNYGLGWQVVERDGRKWVAHPGRQQGARTLLVLLPSEGIAIAILTNLEQASPEKIATPAIQILLRK
jgi:CubicO group peptidase (beta-lactamase class C family)